MLFPQLVMVVHFRDYVNTYGAAMSFIIGLTVRILGGEPYIGIPATIHYPWYDAATGTQNFPFRTVSMLVSLLSLIMFSALFKLVFTKELLPKRWDVCECFTRKGEEKDVLMRNSSALQDTISKIKNTKPKEEYESDT
ncbi:unnamed protein product, partial [Meganyctiphanes norvegica]